MIICIHHTDLDGILAGCLVKEQFPEAELIAMNYDDPVPEIPEDAVVIIVDYALPTADMVRLAKNNPLTWIDHHEAKIKEVVAELDGQLLKDYKALLRVGVGACQLVWEFYHPEEKIPTIIDLASHYDVYKKNGRYDWNKEIFPFQLGMNALFTSVAKLVEVGLANINVQAVSSGGHFINSYQRQINARVAVSAFEAKFDQGVAVCLNTVHMNAEAFETVYDPAKHDFMLAFRYVAQGNKWIFSVRSIGDKFNCATFAQGFGGNGHRNAAGFAVNNLGVLFNNIEVKPNDNRATRRRKQAAKGNK